MGLIGPFLSLIINPESLNETLKEYIFYLGIPLDQKSLLSAMGIALLFTFAFKTIVAISINRYMINFCANQQIRLRAFLMQSYQSLPYTDFIRRNSSEYVSYIQDFTSRFTGVLSTLIKTLSDAIIATAIFILLAVNNPLALGLLVLLLGGSVFAYDRIFRKNMSEYGKAINFAQIKMVKGVNEGIGGLKEIRILGKQNHFHQMVDWASKDISIISAKREIITMVPRFLLEMVMVIFIVSLVLLLLFFNQNLTSFIPTLGMFGLASLRLIPMANVITTSLVQLRFGRDSISRLYIDIKSLEKIKPKVHLKSESYKETSFRSLKLNKISFAYPNSNQKVLENLSLKIVAGESVGLIGPSGAGKTTLVDVILGLLEPQAGSIKYNDEPLKNNLLDWRSKVAYLPQEIFLIDDSLRANIALGEDIEQINSDRLYESLKKARLIELVDELELGVDTLLGEKGVRLSGGQRQRVALARAFYHNRNVLVMDEATSALDDKTEKEVVSAIKRLKGEKTMIIIAHRLSTVKDCDRIYRLEKGKNVDFGTPEQMLKIEKIN